MRLTSSDTKRTLMHLFLFTNSAQRELVSICTHYAEYTRPQLTFLALHPWCSLNPVPSASHYTLFPVRWILYILSCALYFVSCTLYTSSCTLFSVFILYIPFMYHVCTLYPDYLLCIVPVCTLHGPICTLHVPVCTLHVPVCTLYVPCMYPIPCNLSLALILYEND